MPALAQIRSAIVLKMNGIANIGQVHDYERFAKREADFKALFEWAGPPKQIRGWIVRRITKTERSEALGRVAVTNEWQIRGYMSFDDASASEKTFDDLVEAIADAFRADENLDGVVDSIVVDEVAAIQLEDSGPVMFAGVLAHSARLRLLTRHYL